MMAMAAAEMFALYDKEESAERSKPRNFECSKI